MADDRDPDGGDEHDDIGVPRSLHKPPETDVILRRIVDVVNNARPMPLSASVMISREEVLEMLEEAIEKLPDELRASRWLLKERDEFLAKTRRDADDLLNEARSRAEQMVQRTEVVKAAELKARQTIDAADAEAHRLRMECEDYCDRKLASFENVLERTLKVVGAGRSKLQANPMTGETPVVEEPDDSGFFDQDQE